MGTYKGPKCEQDFFCSFVYKKIIKTDYWQAQPFDYDDETGPFRSNDVVTVLSKNIESEREVHYQNWRSKCTMMCPVRIYRRHIQGKEIMTVISMVLYQSNNLKPWQHRCVIARRY